MNKDEPTWDRFRSLPQERQAELLESAYLAIRQIHQHDEDMKSRIWFDIIHHTNCLYNEVRDLDRLAFSHSGLSDALYGPCVESILQDTSHLMYRTRILKYDHEGCVLELSSDSAEEDVFYVGFEDPGSVVPVIRHVFWLCDLETKTHPSRCLTPSQTRSGTVYGRV